MVSMARFFGRSMYGEDFPLIVEHKKLLCLDRTYLEHTLLDHNRFANVNCPAVATEGGKA